MGASAMGCGAPLPAARGGRSPLLYDARSGARRRARRRRRELAASEPIHGGRDRRVGAHAAGARRRGVRRGKGVGRGFPGDGTGKPLPTPSHLAYDGWPEADIAVSDDSSVVLSVRAADCVPVLLADRHGRAVAAVHAGWRGTAAGAVIVAVRALAERFHTKPADVVAAVGPSIGACCYEVGADLAGHFSAHAEAPCWFSSDARPRLDLWRATRDQLTRAGVPAAQVHVAALCTFDHPALLHSYRRDGARAGRLVAAIRSARGRTP